MPITIAEKMLEWISTYPRWTACLSNVCMLPKDLEEISRQTDVLGNVRVGCRCYVTLCWEMPTMGSETEDAERLLRFIQWVQYESAIGHGPALGDVPAMERLRTEKSGLTLGGQTVTYTVTLVADFMKVYEVK